MQPTFHKRKAELAFLEDFFARVVHWCEASEDLLAATLAEAGAVPLSAVDAIHVAASKRLKADELITAEPPGKPLYKARGLRVSFLPNAWRPLTRPGRPSCCITLRNWFQWTSLPFQPRPYGQ